MKTRATQRGLTLTEVLVSLLLLSLVIVPAIEALHIGVLGNSVNEELANSHVRLSGRLEEVLAEPFPALVSAAETAGSETIPSIYSEPAGPGQLLVFVAFYDGDNADGDGQPFTGGDRDLLWIRVEIVGTVHHIDTLLSRSTHL